MTNILGTRVFQRLFAFVVLTSVYGGILFTQQTFSIFWWIATAVETLFFVGLYNFIQLEIYKSKTEGLE